MTGTGRPVTGPLAAFKVGSDPQPRPRCASAQCPLSGQASADNNIITSATEVERMSEREGTSLSIAWAATESRDCYSHPYLTIIQWYNDV